MQAIGGGERLEKRGWVVQEEFRLALLGEGYIQYSYSYSSRHSYSTVNTLAEEAIDIDTRGAVGKHYCRATSRVRHDGTRLGHSSGPPKKI